MRPTRQHIASWGLLLAMTVFAGFGCESVGLRSMKIYMQQQNWEAALEQGRKAVAENPSDADAWFNIALVAAQIDSIDTMIEATERTKELTSKYDEDLAAIAEEKYSDLYNRGVTLFNAQRYDAANRQLNNAYKILPDRPYALKVLGLIAQIEEDIDSALEYYGKALDADTTDTELARQYAGLLNSVEKRDEAIAVMERTYNAYPTNKDVVITYASLLQYEQRFDDAINAVASALDEAPEDPDLLMQTGVLQMSKSQSIADTDSAEAMRFIEMAIPNFEKVLEIDSSNVDAAFNLSLAYSAVGELEKSAEPLAAVVETSPEDLQARMQYATVLLQLEKPVEAEPHLLYVTDQIGEPTNVYERRALSQAYRYLHVIYLVRANQLSVEAQDLREEAKDNPSRRAALREQAAALDAEADELSKKSEEMSQAAKMYSE